MHPALSVIFFTVASGCGYGVLYLLGLILLVQPALLSRGEILALLVFGALASSAGLASSTFHLGQPQRAWRAFSQWRSSWLSREGVAAALSFVPVGALLAAQWLHADAALVRAIAFSLALLAAVTVYCTAQIYASLKTIAAWHNAYVTPGYLLFALLGGSAWLHAWHSLLDDRTHAAVGSLDLGWLLIALCVAAALLKRAYWRHIDTQPLPASIETATGLGRFGAVRSAETLHTEENYLTREMGFALARKHSARLRRIALAMIAALPIALLLIAMFAPSFAWLLSLIAAATITAGLFVERWLFFAEAKHVVMLYYGLQTQRG